MKENQWMSTREAAKLLDASVRSIQLWSDAGVLHAYRSPGGHRRITRASVEALVASREAAARGPTDINQPDCLQLASEALGPDSLVSRMREVAGGIVGQSTLEHILEQIGRLNTQSSACWLEKPVKSGELHENTHILIIALVHTLPAR